jgi:hypothetical protein
MTALALVQVLLCGCHGWLVHTCFPHCWTSWQWHPVCAALLAAEQPPDGDVGLLPPDGFLQTWFKTKKPRVFTAADLYGHIDGGAEIFLEFGFEQLTVQGYAAKKNPSDDKPAGEIKLEIYRMSDATAALGIYLLNRGKETRDPGFAERHGLNKYQLIFQRDRYYAVVNNPSGKESSRAAMLEFARCLAARMPKDNTPDPREKLPHEGLDPATLRLARGQFGLQSVFTLGKGNILQLGRQVTAAAAEYRNSSGGHTLIQVEYPSEEAARKAFQNLRTNLDECLKPLRAVEDRLEFKDNRGKYGLAMRDGKRLAIKLRLSSPP